MDLYLIRHGDAAPLGEGGVMDDTARPLTHRGRNQAKALGEQLQRHGVRLRVVLTSPLVRARQTAEEMLAQWAPPAPELRLCDELAFGGRRKRLARLLNELQTDSVALVGHQPDMGELTAWLIGSRRARVEFAKGGVAYILSSDEPGKGSGALQWMLTPQWLGG